MFYCSVLQFVAMRRRVMRRASARAREIVRVIVRVTCRSGVDTRKKKKNKNVVPILKRDRNKKIIPSGLRREESVTGWCRAYDSLSIQIISRK